VPRERPRVQAVTLQQRLTQPSRTAQGTCCCTRLPSITTTSASKKLRRMHLSLKSTFLRSFLPGGLVLLAALILLVSSDIAQAGTHKRTGSQHLVNAWRSTHRFSSKHHHAPKMHSWSHFESEYLLGRKITFMCSAEGNPRPHITWYKDGIQIYQHAFFQVEEHPVGEYGTKSKMEIDPATKMDAGYYECQADNQHGIDVKAFKTNYALNQG
ncbi:unnamed protein product, partial [Meganyctiphanes norvegica]